MVLVWACFGLVRGVWGLDRACLARLEGARYEREACGREAGTEFRPEPVFSPAMNYSSQTRIPQGQ